MRRRDTILIVIAAIVIAILAWLFLAGGSSDAPEEAPGSSIERVEAVWGVSVPVTRAGSTVELVEKATPAESLSAQTQLR